jgi:hypothetical protein
MNWLAIVTVTTALCGGMVSGVMGQDAPTTQPEESENELRQDMMRSYGRSFMGRWGGPGGDFTDEDWEAAEAFMQEHSPNRWKLFEQLPEGSPRRGPVMRMIIARYRNLQSTREEDAALYELRLQQLTLEDGIWFTVREMRNQVSDEQRATLETNLRDKVAAAVDVWLKERERRLQRLEETLKLERERLATDLNRREEMVENRLQREMEKSSDFMSFPGSRRGRQN